MYTNKFLSLTWASMAAFRNLAYLFGSRSRPTFDDSLDDYGGGDDDGYDNKGDDDDNGDVDDDDDGDDDGRPCHAGEA